MIEAMACGTPVLAFRCGSVSEIVDEGLTGITVTSVEQAIAALPQLLALDRANVRRRFEQRFSSTRMAKEYIALYHTLVAANRAQESPRQFAVPPLIKELEPSLQRPHLG